jgi:hypothetical protein
MLGENGFCDNGPHTAGSKGSHQRGDGMDEEDDEIAHPLSYQFPNSNTFNVLGISPGTGEAVIITSFRTVLDRACKGEYAVGQIFSITWKEIGWADQ